MHSRWKPTKIFVGGENTKNENRQNGFFLIGQISNQLESWLKYSIEQKEFVIKIKIMRLAIKKQ